MASMKAAKVVAPAVRAKAATVTPVAWVASGEIDLAEWVAAGRRLGAVGRSSQWWLGDWIRYGNAKFGERYARAASITGYDAQTLMNMVYVASRFSFSRRREKLSWSHHETVAALDQDEQERWLDFAREKRLAVADLRLELRARKAASDWDRGDDSLVSGGDPTLVCPNCGQGVPVGTYKVDA